MRDRAGSGKGLVAPSTEVESIGKENLTNLDEVIRANPKFSETTAPTPFGGRGTYEASAGETNRRITTGGHKWLEE